MTGRWRLALWLAIVAVVTVMIAVLVACTGPFPPPETGPAWPDATNTGVPAGTTLTPYDGFLRVTTPGTVVDGLDITGCIDIKAANVTIKRTRVRMANNGDCGNEMIHNYLHGTGYANLLIEDVELDGGTLCGEMIGVSSYTARRVNMHHCSDGPRISENADVTIVDSWIHNPLFQAGDHPDGIQSAGAVGPVTIVHNRIDVTGGAANAAFMPAGWSSGPLLLENNLLAGGGFTLALYDNDATVRHNRFVKGAYGYAAVGAYCYGPKNGNPEPGCTVVEWTDNAEVDSAGVLYPIGNPG